MLDKLCRNEAKQKREYIPVHNGFPEDVKKTFFANIIKTFFSGSWGNHVKRLLRTRLKRYYDVTIGPQKEVFIKPVKNVFRSPDSDYDLIKPVNNVFSYLLKKPLCPSPQPNDEIRNSTGWCSIQIRLTLGVWTSK